jgi:hypothetical protein
LENDDHATKRVPGKGADETHVTEVRESKGRELHTEESSVSPGGVGSQETQKLQRVNQMNLSITPELSTLTGVGNGVEVLDQNSGVEFKSQVDPSKTGDSSTQSKDLLDTFDRMFSQRNSRISRHQTHSEGIQFKGTNTKTPFIDKN